MADINTALNASKDAMEQLLIAGERTKTAWTSPRAPGKWSPSQIVEHVARSLEESANMAAGRPSKFPKLPAVIHPVARGLLFRRVLRCLVPQCGSGTIDATTKETLWDRYFTGAPRPLTPSELQDSDRRLRSRR